MSTSGILANKNMVLQKIKEKGMGYSFKRGLYIILCQIVGVLGYPLCMLLNIRFLPVYTPGIGHLSSEPDCYIKEGILGLRPQYNTIVLAPRNKTANSHMLKYWKKYLKIIEQPLICSILKPFSENRFTSYYIFDYFFTYSSRYPEVQRKYGNRTPLLSLTDFDKKRGWDCLESLGVEQNAWFVCVHCREDGYLGDVGQTMRNADVNNYLLAMDEIVKRGGWVIRMGDPSMKPVNSKGRIIDYAHLSIKSDWMDVFLCALCKFFLGSNSGLTSLAAIFGVPSGNANYCPISAVVSYGVQDVGIPKPIWSIKEKRYLTFEEIFNSQISIDRLDSMYVQAGVKAIENSPEEIRDLAIEMLEKVEGLIAYTQEDERLQNRFKSLMSKKHYSYGALSRVGRDFLRKYKDLLPKDM